MSTFVAGTRGSALALWQTQLVVDLLRDRAPGRPEVRQHTITTKGDTSLADRLVGQLEKGFFTEELEAALRSGSIQLAVHSLKDLPTRMSPGLCLGAVLERANPYDLLMMRPEAVREGPGLPIGKGARIGSSSLRRASLLARFAPGAEAVPLRGNVPTRVEKLRAGKYDGILLAAAGVQRLELPLDGLAVFKLEPRAWNPAPGQGAIGVQCREDDDATRTLLTAIHDPDTAEATAIERDLLRVFEGGCSTPFGCYVEGKQVWVGLQAHGRWRAARWALGEDKPDWERQLAALSAPDYVETPHDFESICSRL
jgi:hydroxymethylbilane synthase